MAKEQGQKRTIFILYLPGGAMLGIVPAVVLARLEELTESPAAELFQVFDGVSTGSILVAGLNSPGMNSAMGVELFCSKGPAFFPEIPGRKGKMIFANTFNLAEDFLDPEKADEFTLHEIRKLCEDLKILLPSDKHSLADGLKERAARRWITGRDKRSILKQCETLAKTFPDLEDKLSTIGELVLVRTSGNRLTNLFKSAAISAMNIVKKHWAHDYLFSPDAPRKTYEDLFGERRMSDCRRSVYISTYDAHNNKVITFFNRRKDFFSLSPDVPTETSPGNHKLWDAVMASTANPYAFPPHKTEDGIVCVDKAIIHPPFTALQDVLEHKPADANIKLVILGTGKYLRKLPDDRIIEYYKNLGVLGNLMKGREIAELEGYIMSVSRTVLAQLLGKDNLIEISPRLAPHTYSETQDFPSRDTLDASEENIKKIMKQSRALLVEQDETIRNLAQMLADNLHLLGQMDEEKYNRVSRRIGIKSEAKPLETGIGKDLPNMYTRIFGAPGLKHLFAKWAKSLTVPQDEKPATPLLPAPGSSPTGKPEEPKPPSQ